jgi:uncharacterized protein DUF1801
MPKSESKDLKKFLKPYPKDVQANALRLRDWLWDQYPGCNELIYDNYNALAFGLSLSDTAGDAFVSIAVFSSSLNFGFNRGTEISDPKNLLIGNGKLYRYIKVTDLKDFPKAYAKKLVRAAYVNAKARYKKGKITLRGETIVKLIMEKKRRPK